MKNVIRYDNFNLDEVKITRTPEGYLEGYAIATRTGVFSYMKADGSIQRELRIPAEVFQKDAINSFKMLPITDEHPDEGVNADNAKELAVGFTGEDVKRKDDSFLLTKLKITDKKAIDAINSGKRGLSYGYNVDLVKEDGIHNGEKYDYVQTNIRGNHLAIVYQGRAGNKARLNLDKQEAVCVFNNLNNFNNLSMKQIRLDGKDYEVSDEVFSKIDTLETSNANLKSSEKDLQKKVDSLEGERDALKAKVDELSDKDYSEVIDSKVKERISLEKKACEFLKKDEDISSLSDKDIKTKVIIAFSPEFKADEKNDEYINARFDAVIDMKKDVNLGKNMEITGSKKDSEDSEVALSNEDLQRNLIQRTLKQIYLFKKGAIGY